MSRPTDNFDELAHGTAAEQFQALVRLRESLVALGFSDEEALETLARDVTAASTPDDILAAARDMILASTVVRSELHTDKLTGVKNRIGFMHELVKRIEAMQGDRDALTAVVFVDLDGFKAVNDALGHDVGDEALRECARRLSAILKRDTDEVARFGGDEMVCLLSYEVADGRRQGFNEEAIRDKIRAAFDGLVYFGPDGTPYPIGASLGVEIFDANALKDELVWDMAQMLVKKADEKMYEDKAGKPARLQAAREAALVGGRPEPDTV